MDEEAGGLKRQEVYHSALGEVTPEERALFRDLSWTASMTWGSLTMGWMRQRRHEGHDIAALDGALRLDHHCAQLLEHPTTVLHANTNYFRYELLAGALVVRELIPVPLHRRGGLLATVQDFDSATYSWKTPPDERDVDMIASWRSWLRNDGIRRAGHAELYGRASLLAAASYRLILALNPGRGRLTRPPEEARTLAFRVEREPWRHAD